MGARRDTFGIFSDFVNFVTAQDGWSSLAADTNASATIDADGVGGILVLNTGDATDNNEASVFSTQELFLSAPGKPIRAMCRLQYTEPNTNAGNVAFGLADVMGGANTLLDDGGGPAASFYGAMIYKTDGSTVWKAASSAGTLSSAGTTSTAVQTAGGAAYQELMIVIEPISGAFNQSKVSYFLDGLPLTDSLNRPITHTVGHGAAATGEMNVGIYAKVGAANNSWVVQCDYMGAWQER